MRRLCVEALRSRHDRLAIVREDLAELLHASKFPGPVFGTAAPSLLKEKNRKGRPDSGTERDGLRGDPRTKTYNWMTARGRIRMAAYRWHCLIARGETATRLYISLVAYIARLIPSRRVREMIVWAVTGQRVPWKPLAFASRKVIVGTQTDIKLMPHLGEFDGVALFGCRLDYEVPVFDWLEKNAVDRYDAIVEIGANVGVYSVFFDALIRRSCAGRLRQVYAFEPSRTAYGRLLLNLEANDSRYVEPFAVAVSDEAGFSPFWEPQGHLTNGSLMRNFAELFSQVVKPSTCITVAGSTLAGLFARHGRVLLKIDAEGHEPQIIAGMASLLERYRPDLLIEILEGVDLQLSALDCLDGYTCFLIAADGLSRRERLSAEPAHRDWLLTTSSLET
jgi:FkbM family methyltransferase